MSRKWTTYVNAEKTTIAPFTRNRKLDKLVERILGGRAKGFTAEVKHLGINSRCNCNIANTVNKMALGISYRTAGQSWGLKLKMTLWLYKAIVRPIVTYASVVWSAEVSQTITVAILDSLRHIMCLLVTMSTTPGAALNT